MPTLLRPATDLALTAKLFRGLGDSSRLAILEALRDGEQCVGTLVATTGLSQPNVSNHLACLRDCGLVDRQQRGRHAHYRLADPRVADLLALADALLGEVSRGVAACPRYGPEAGEQGKRDD